MKILKKGLASLTVLATLTSISACSTNSTLSQDFLFNNDQTMINSITGKAKWTIAIHLAADNNLYSAGLDDINEMEAGLTSPDVNVIVLFDGAQDGDSRIYKIKHEKDYNEDIISEVVNDKGVIIPSSNEIDSGDPKLFAKFMDWVSKNYPAENNAVIIWNHGDGIFRSKNSSQIVKPIKARKAVPGEITTNGFAWDDNGGNMNLKDLNPAFAGFMRNSGKKIDILDFDACLMAHVEAAYQVKESVNYLVASEKTEPGDGNDYVGILKALSAKPDMTGADLSTVMVDTYGESYSSGGSQGESDVTLSAVDVNMLSSNLVPAINGLATALSKNPSSAKLARSGSESYENSYAADLGHFLSLLGKDAKVSQEIKTAAGKVQTELKKTVIREAHTNNSPPPEPDPDPLRVENATGLVIYFPQSGSINPKYTDPSATKFAEQPAWGNFLKSFIK